MCGHEVWVTSKARPKRKETNCTQCTEKRIGKKLTKKKPTDFKKLINPKAFASSMLVTPNQLEGGRPQEEVMLHVYWSALGDARDVREGGQGHRMQRDKVTASLGLDRAPDPGFTKSEMQDITFAAKMAALKCLRARKRK